MGALHRRRDGLVLRRRCDSRHRCASLAVCIYAHGESHRVSFGTGGFVGTAKVPVRTQGDPRLRTKLSHELLTTPAYSLERHGPASADAGCALRPQGACAHSQFGFYALIRAQLPVRYRTARQRVRPHPVRTHLSHSHAIFALVATRCIPLSPAGELGLATLSSAPHSWDRSRHPLGIYSCPALV